MTDDNVIEDLEREPAVQEVMRWLGRGAPKSGYPSDEMVEKVLSLAFGLEEERDAARTQLAAERAGGERSHDAMQQAVLELQAEVERLRTELMAAGLEAHYAEHPHLAPSAEEVARAVLEQEHRLPAEMERLRERLEANRRLRQLAEDDNARLRAELADERAHSERLAQTVQEMTGQLGTAPRHDQLLALWQAQVERLKSENASILLAKVTEGPTERQLTEARLVARHLWRLNGVREQWDPPAKYELDWLTSEGQS